MVLLLVQCDCDTIEQELCLFFVQPECKTYDVLVIRFPSSQIVVCKLLDDLFVKYDPLVFEMVKVLDGSDIPVLEDPVLKLVVISTI